MLQRLFLFITPILVSALLLDFLFKVGQKHFDSYSGYKFREILDTGSIDCNIIVFGSSVAEGAINPQIINDITSKSCFNASLSGRRIVDWSGLAYAYIDYSKNTEYIILDLFPNVFNYSELLYQPHEFYPYLNNTYIKTSIKNINSTYEKLCSIPFYYFTQLNSVFVRNTIVGIRDILFDIEPTVKSNYLGYHNYHQEFLQSDVTNLIPPRIHENSLNLYQQLIKKAADKGIQVIIVGMPVYKDAHLLYPNLNDVYKWGDIFAAEYDNVNYLNFYKDQIVTSDKNHFANYTHLSKNGASLISKRVAAFIKDREKLKNEF